MNSVLRLIERAFDLLFYLVRGFPLILILSVFAILTAVVALLVFRRVSDQRSIRRAKDQIGAHVLEIRLFSDQLGVVVRAYFASLKSIVIYLRHILRPILILFVPLFFLFLQLDGYFAHTPLNAGQDFLVQTKLSRGQPVESLTMQLPNGVAMTAPPVHIPVDREIVWRLRADQDGTFLLRLRQGQNDYAKRLVVGQGLKRVNWDRESGGIWEALTTQGEAPLPARGPIQYIRVQYPDRVITIWGWEMDWWVYFLIVMLIAALLLKGALRTEL